MKNKNPKEQTKQSNAKQEKAKEVKKAKRAELMKKYDSILKKLS